MTRSLTIGTHSIDDDGDCYVIAEVGNNHQGSMEKAIDLFHSAKMAGVQAVKLQKRDNKSLYTKAAYDKPYENENSFGKTYGEHRDFLEFGKREYRELAQLARELKLDFFATAFDFPSADFLAEFDMPVYKIASGDLKNIPLIKYVAKLGKPLIVSVGGGTIEDARRVYEAVMPINPQLCLLQCTATYPTEAEDMNLRTITTLREEFPGVVVGLSDHYNGIAMAVVAYVLGARVIEKHFTLNHTWKGTDHALSLEPIGMHKMVRDLQRARAALGDGVKRVLPQEVSAITKMSKSLVAARDLPAGHVLASGDVAMKCPGGGIPPAEIDNVVGRRLARAVAGDAMFAQPIWRLLERRMRVLVPTARPDLPAPIEGVVRAIRLVAFDFDGVFTDNMVYVGQDGAESVRCTRADGIGLRKLERLGIHPMIISTEKNPVVGHRSRKIGIEFIQGSDDKREALDAVMKRHSLSLDQIAFVGNDINDLPCLECVGLPIVVRDAHPDVVPFARLQTDTPGGHGAVREVCDYFDSVFKQAGVLHA